MICEEILARSENQIVNFIKNYVTRTGAENKTEVLELFDSTYRFFPHWVIATCPMAHPEIYYVSNNASHVFGYPTEYLIEHSRMEKYFTHVHDADQGDFI
jgi:hypothetical protein